MQVQLANIPQVGAPPSLAQPVAYWVEVSFVAVGSVAALFLVADVLVVSLAVVPFSLGGPTCLGFVVNSSVSSSSLRFLLVSSLLLSFLAAFLSHGITTIFSSWDVCFWFGREALAIFLFAVHGDALGLALPCCLGLEVWVHCA